MSERAELPWLTLSYSDLITSRGFKYVFQTAPTAEAQATALLPRVVDLAKAATGTKPTKVAFVGDNSASSVSFMKPIREHVAKDLGLTIVADEVYTPPLADATIARPADACCRRCHSGHLPANSSRRPPRNSLQRHDRG